MSGQEEFLDSRRIASCSKNIYVRGTLSLIPAEEKNKTLFLTVRFRGAGSVPLGSISIDFSHR
jgi:hypothetical protein